MGHINRLIELNKELQQVTERRLVIEDEINRYEQLTLKIHGDGESFDPFIYKTGDEFFLCTWEYKPGVEWYVGIEALPVVVNDSEPGKED